MKIGIFFVLSELVSDSLIIVKFILRRYQPEQSRTGLANKLIINEILSTY
jgi:hypothetical protein